MYGVNSKCLNPMDQDCRSCVCTFLMAGTQNQEQSGDKLQATVLNSNCCALITGEVTQQAAKEPQLMTKYSIKMDSESLNVRK